MGGVMLFLAIGFVVGLYCGLAAARWLKVTEKPIRTVRYDYMPPVTIRSEERRVGKECRL